MSVSLYILKLLLPFNQSLVLSVHMSKMKLACKENVSSASDIVSLTLKHEWLSLQFHGV